MHRLGARHFGGPRTPHEVRNLRISVIEQCMKLGQPVVWRHQFNNDDEADDYVLELHGVSKQTIAVRKCPACFDEAYGQVRNDCPVCFGVGWASVETDPTKWIVDDGNEVSGTDDGTGINAPRWGGFGPPVLTWLVEPDTSVDIFRLDRSGALVRTQAAQGIAPWYPEMGDNDLIVNVDLASNLQDIQREMERYQLKMVQPQTVRGWGSRTRNQEHKAGQTFEMARIPRGTILMEVPVQ